MSNPPLASPNESSSSSSGDPISPPPSPSLQAQALNIRLLNFVILSCFGAAYFGYTSGVIGGCLALPSFQVSFNLPPSGTGAFNNIATNIVSSIYLGTLLGALAIIPVADVFGPRMGLAVSAAIYMAGSAMQTWSCGAITLMYAGRAIAGVGMGGSTSVAPMYISEISPPLIRGALIGIHEITFQVTSVFGFWVNYGVHRNIPSTSAVQWMIPLGVQLVPGSILLLSTLFILPESPRFLVRTERSERAQQVLGYIRKLPITHPEILSEMYEIKAHFDDIRSTTSSQNTRFAGIRGILSSWAMVKRVATGCLMMLFLNTTGVVALNTYTPTIFRALGFDGTDLALMLTGCYGVVKSLSVTVSSVFFVDRYGRRVLLIVSAVGVSSVMWYLGGYVTLHPNNPPQAQPQAQSTTTTSPSSYLALSSIYLFAFFFALSSNVPWIYCAEIFPMHFRATGVSITTTAQFAAEYFVTKASPYMLTDIGGGTFFFFAACTAANVLWVAVCVPETKGRTLEAMEEAFTRGGGGGRDVEGGGQVGKGKVVVGIDGSG